MVSRTAATLALLVLCCVVSGVVGTTENGLPRPQNFLDAPSASYGPTPVLTSSTGVSVDCEWYGWANTLYDAATGAACLDVLRMALTNATVNPPQDLEPYIYYTIKRLIDPSNNQSYCYEGCFDLGDLAPSPSPLGVPSASAPPPVVFSSPPAPTPSGVLAPSPLSATPPPLLLTPAGSPPVMEPAAGTPAPLASPASSSSPAPAITSIVPPTSSPPAPATTLVNLNGGSSVAPSALLSCLLAGVALRFLNL